MSIRNVLAAAVLTSVLFSWASAQTVTPAPQAASPAPDAQAATPPPPAFPEAPARSGKDILESSCTGCHDLGVLTATPHAAEEWPGVLKRMVGNGLNITPTDLSTVQAYLVEHYSAEPGAH